MKTFFSEKTYKLKFYSYKDNFIKIYGSPIFDKTKYLIGYNLNETECASITTYFNDNNLLCNKVSIKDFDEGSLSFKGEAILS
jgi:hypothetical protein